MIVLDVFSSFGSYYQFLIRAFCSLFASVLQNIVERTILISISNNIHCSPITKQAVGEQGLLETVTIQRFDRKRLAKASFSATATHKVQRNGGEI